MARVDDYINARKIAVEYLAGNTPDEIAESSGYRVIGKNRLRVPFLNRVYMVNWPEFEFEDESAEKKDVPLQEQVLILHYLAAKNEGKSSGRWISFREIPGAAFYYSAFVKRAVDPLKKTFGKDAGLFVKAAGKLNGRVIDAGNAGFEFNIFPKVSLQLILWEGDDEFPPEANILFYDTIGDIFTPEDVAWLAGMLVYRLMALAR
ncbi:MAG: DUF3786 domain-containing protein [Desulfobacteraceae bacterium]|nr:MAG: DUF3786 domain-containing protein [Desulfobacteraceae bacterium]